MQTLIRNPVVPARTIRVSAAVLIIAFLTHTAQGHLAPQPDSEASPAIIAKHSNFSNGITPILKCDLRDKDSSPAGCRDAIGSLRLALERLKMRAQRNHDPASFDQERLRIEKQLARNAAVLAYINAHPAGFAGKPPVIRFGYRQSPQTPPTSEPGRITQRPNP